MRDWFILIAHLIVTTIRTVSPGGARAVIAESLLLKHQLLILNRSRKKAPKLRTVDRIVLGLGAMLVSPQRMLKVAVAVRPATLLRFHRALVRRKCQWLFSSSTRRRPGPKGPSKKLIVAILEIKRLSSDHDPLFRFHRWRANLRVLDIEEIKSIPFVPRSHPFVERLIGTLRREYLDQTFFWNGLDLRRKLDRFATYYNQRRVHAGSGRTPVERCGTTVGQPANLDHFAWRSDCSGLFHTPIPA